MKVTKKLRAYLTDNHELPQDADDNAVKSMVAGLIIDGSLDRDKVVELTKSETDVEAKIGEIVSREMAKAMGEFTEVLKGFRPAEAATTETPAETKAVNLETDGEAAKTVKAAMTESEREPEIRVKSVVEQFDDTKTVATYAKSSNPFNQKFFGNREVSIGESIGMAGRKLHMPTERSKAIAGAWFKRMINNAYRASGRMVPDHFKMTELDNKIVEYTVNECKFVGPLDFDDRQDEASNWAKGLTLNDTWKKALLDDGTSGGLEAVPIEFDDAAIITPLLEGELFPLVDVRNVTRRRIEGFSIGNPTIAWGVAEGSSIALFNTASFVAAFDTTIYPVTGAMEIGLDFLADSPVDIGAIIVNRYGAQFRKEMDDVIAKGLDGSSQPNGLFETAGLVAVNSENGSTGPWTVTDLEALLFGVGKEFRQEAGRNRSIFLSNDTTYQRLRGIEVGASDQRRVLGMDHESYMTLGHPHKVNEDVTNPELGFFCMNRYRMYRRAGFGVRVVTEDQDLALKNLEMIVVRARVGGQFELGAAGAEITDGQS